MRELAKELKRGETPDVTRLGFDTADWAAHPLGQERVIRYGDRCISTKDPDVATIDETLEPAGPLGACIRGDDELYRRPGRGLECYTPDWGWLLLDDFHRGRPPWAPAIIREILRRESPPR